MKSASQGRKTQELYCKAVVSASGGHRLARDYVAGLAAALLTGGGGGQPSSPAGGGVQAGGGGGEAREGGGKFAGHSSSPSSSLPSSSSSSSGSSSSTSLCSLGPGWSSPGALLQLALQHPADPLDMYRFRAHLLDLWCDDGECTVDEPVDDHHYSAVSDNPHPLASRVKKEEAEADRARQDTHTHEEEEERVEREAAELFLLSHSPIVRCLLYDTMCASLYQRPQVPPDLLHSAASTPRDRLARLGVEVFGVPRERLLALWEIALRETVLHRDLYHLLVPVMD